MILNEAQLNPILTSYTKFYQLDLEDVKINRRTTQYFVFKLGNVKMVIYEVPFKQYRITKVIINHVEFNIHDYDEEGLADMWNTTTRKFKNLIKLNNKI